MQEALQELQRKREAVESDIVALIKTIEKELQAAEPKEPKQITI